MASDDVIVNGYTKLSLLEPHHKGRKLGSIQCGSRECHTNHTTCIWACLHVCLLTCTIPATCEEKLSLNITSPVFVRRTSIFPLDQPVMSSGVPSPFMSKLCVHIGWFLDWSKREVEGEGGGVRKSKVETIATKTYNPPKNALTPPPPSPTLILHCLSAP